MRTIARNICENRYTTIIKHNNMTLLLKKDLSRTFANFINLTLQNTRPKLIFWINSSHLNEILAVSDYSSHAICSHIDVWNSREFFSSELIKSFNDRISRDCFRFSSRIFEGKNFKLIFKKLWPFMQKSQIKSSVYRLRRHKNPLCLSNTFLFCSEFQLNHGLAT